MNAGLVLSALFFLLGAVLIAGLAGRSRTRLYVVLASVHLVGNSLVAGVPETIPLPTGQLHALGALLAIVGGNLAVLYGGRALSSLGMPRWLRGASAAIGSFGLAAFTLLLARTLARPDLVPALGEGLVERFSVYTITAWEILAGILLIRASPVIPEAPVRQISNARADARS
jgi:hypothetical protein